MMQGEHAAMTSNECSAPYEWSITLRRKNPQKFWVVLVIALFAGLLGLFLLKSLVMGVIGVGAILLSTADFWMPVRYRIDDNEVSAKVGLSTTALAWSDVKRVLTSEMGVKLTPLEKDSSLSPFRGVFLRFDGNKKDVLNAITKRWEGELGLLD